MDGNDSSNSESENKRDDWKSWTPEVFLATILHELRTPMMIIKGYTHILADENAKDHHLEAIGAISHAIERMELLWQDMADYARLIRKT